MRRSTLLLVVLSLTTLLGCGGGDSGSQKDAVVDPSDQSSDAANDVAPGDVQEDLLPPCSGSWVLEFFGVEDNMTVETGRTYPIQARMYDSATLQFVAGEPVTLELVGEGDAQLTTDQAVTDANGSVEIGLQTGSVENATYTIHVSHRCADKISLNLTTIAPEKGTFVITVEISPELQALASDLDVTLYLDNTIPYCGAFDFTKPTGVAVAVPAGQSVVEFKDALSSSTYLISAVGIDTKGLPIGGGCTEGVFVLKDRTEEVTVTLFPLDLNPVGNYDGTLTGDVFSLIPEPLRDPGKELHDLLKNSPDTIAQHILDDLAPYFPEGLPTTCNENPVDIPKEIKDSIAMGLGQNFPPAPFPAIRDDSAALLQAMLGDVNFTVTFTVQPKQGTEYPAKLHITQIQLAGDLPCGNDCKELLTIPFDAFTGGEVVFEWEDVESTLTTSNLEQWALPEYQVSLRPGKLFLLAFVHTVLPAYGLTDSIQDLLGPLYNCTSLVSGISFVTTTCLNKNVQFFVDSCAQAVADIRLEFYDRFGGLLAEQMLEGVFSGTMNDPNNDLKAESLDGGFSGSFILETGGVPASQGTFDWDFTAAKAAN